MLLPKGTYIYIGYLVSSTIDTNTLIHISTTYAMNNQPIIDSSNSICESKLPSEFDLESEDVIVIIILLILLSNFVLVFINTAKRNGSIS
jgi:hypothetical protein